MESLPSLNGLKAFEATARHKSFTKAAQELCVTQGAISHQMKNLEEELGITLVLREPNSISLTPEGEKLFQATHSAFSQIRQAKRGLLEENTHLKIICAPTFATRWLIPRINRFHENNSKLRLQLKTIVSRVNFHNFKDFDAAVTYGEPMNGQSLTIEPLFREVLFPACVPRLLTDENPLTGFQDLAHHILLHSSLERLWWKAWAKKVGLDELKSAGDQCFELEESMIQAVRTGSGVSLVNVYFVQEEIATGELIYPFPEGPSLPLETYYLVCPPNKTNLPAVKKFRKWLCSEMSIFLAQAILPERVNEA